MNSIKTLYRIKLSDELTEEFDYEMDAETLAIVAAPLLGELPAWTALGFKQCPNCPLKPDDHPHCPMAVQLHNIVGRFHDTRSIDEVELEVITEQRRVTQTIPLQNALASLLGLVFPISGCPRTEGMKPLARFHVPLASEEETVFNVAGMYLLAQYFVNVKNRSGVLSFDGLISAYGDLHIVNKHVASRLQAVTSSDSVKNAITLLDMYSSLMPMLLQDQLVEIRRFFNAYLPDDEVVAPTNNYLEQAKALRIVLTPEETAQDAESQAIAALRAEREQQLLEEHKDMAEWLKQSLVRQEMERFKPDMEKVKAMLRPAAAASAPASAKAGEPATPDYSAFVMNLSLEPMEEKELPAAGDAAAPGNKAAIPGQPFKR
ncbi:MAG: hypothetical protein V4729_11855 [Pseudomonadota bacterium]